MPSRSERSSASLRPRSVETASDRPTRPPSGGRVAASRPSSHPRRGPDRRTRRWSGRPGRSAWPPGRAGCGRRRGSRPARRRCRRRRRSSGRSTGARQPAPTSSTTCCTSSSSLRGRRVRQGRMPVDVADARVQDQEVRRRRDAAATSRVVGRSARRKVSAGSGASSRLTFPLDGARPRCRSVRNSSSAALEVCVRLLDVLLAPALLLPGRAERHHRAERREQREPKVAHDHHHHDSHHQRRDDRRQAEPGRRRRGLAGRRFDRLRRPGRARRVAVG